METELYKTRSVQACFRAAYDLFCSNFKTILQKTWMPAVVLSLVMGLYGVICPTNLITLLLGEQPPVQPLGTSLLLVAVYFAMLAATIWLYAIFFSLLNGRSHKENGGRVLRTTGIFLLVGCVAGIFVAIISILLASRTITPPESPRCLPVLAFIVVPICLFVMCMLALIPSIYSAIKYIMEPSQKAWSIFGKPYRQGWHHWGFLFVCALLCFIIGALLSSIAQMPSGIMMLGKLASAGGTLMGDPDGLPSYFNITFYATSSLAQFVCCYLTMWVATVFYYAYGSIEAKMRETTQTTK